MNLSITHRNFILGSCLLLSVGLGGCKGKRGAQGEPGEAGTNGVVASYAITGAVCDTNGATDRSVDVTITGVAASDTGTCTANFIYFDPATTGTACIATGNNTFIGNGTININTALSICTTSAGIMMKVIVDCTSFTTTIFPQRPMMDETCIS